MKAKTLLKKLKELSKKELEKNVYYCDMPVRKVNVNVKEIELK